MMSPKTYLPTLFALGLALGCSGADTEQPPNVASSGSELRASSRDRSARSAPADRSGAADTRALLERYSTEKQPEKTVGRVPAAELEKGAHQVTSDPTQPGYERGVILVQFETGLGNRLRKQRRPGSLIGRLPEEIRKALAPYGLSEISPLFLLAQSSPKHFGQLRGQHKERTRRGDGGKPARLDHVFKLHVSNQADITAAVEALSELPGIVFAQPDRRVEVNFVPSDTFYSDQWGATNATVEQAWNSYTGSPSTVIAIVDTGVDLTHPDLSPNLWVNISDPVNGVDDDGNGYIDDLHGWDFGGNDPNPNDACGHGTHVAGIAAAAGDNARGVAGVAFNSKIMSLKGLGSGCGGSVSDLVAAMLYAVNNGADIINNSWGGTGYDSLVTSTIETATAMGVVVVSAAGNADEEAHDYFPANVERSITVSATTSADIKASYSNFGVKVDVAAPGGDNLGGAGDILSAVPATSFVSGPTVTDNLGDRYMWLAGTSMAAPHVAGLAALVLDAHPAWTVGQVTAVLRKTSLDITTPGFDLDGGHGLIQSEAAVTTTYVGNPPPTAQIVEPRNNETVRGSSVNILGDANTSTPGAKRGLSMGAGAVPSSWTNIGGAVGQVFNGSLEVLNSLDFADGTYTLRMSVGDNNAVKSEERNLVHVDNVWIETPTDNTVLSGVMTVTGGVAGDLGFQDYSLEWAPGCNGTGTFTPFYTSSSQAPGLSNLGPWNTAGLPAGQITLRLTAQFTGHTSTDEKCVISDPYLAPGFPAALQHVPAFKSPQLADLDGDGVQEIVVGASVFQADGSVRPGWTNFPGVGRANSAVLDVNGDGQLNVVAADYDYANVPPTYGAPVINAYEEDKTLIWSHVMLNPWTSPTQSQGTPGTISAGDVDGDGEDEIVVPMFFSYQSGGAPYVTHVHVLDAATGAVEGVHPVSGWGANSVALADLDQDGALDMVTETYDSVAAYGIVYAMDSTGSALPGWPQAVSTTNSQGFGGIDPVIGDVDDDGSLDVMVGKYLFNADGTYHAGWPTTSFSRHTGALGEMDSDCSMEIVQGGGNHLVMRGQEEDATLRFSRYRLFENNFVMMMGENGAPGAPLIADVTGDGDVEAIHSAEYGHTYGAMMPIYAVDDTTPAGTMVTDFPRWVANNNPGGWTDPIRSTPAVGDIDGDGHVDMVVAVAGSLVRWSLPAQVTLETTSVWPMFQHDLRNTGAMLKSSCLGCTSAEQAAVGGIYYPGWSCADAAADMESNLNSYHSRSACHQQVGSDIALPVLESIASSCTVNSSGSAVVFADVCCEPAPTLSCTAAEQATVSGVHYPGTTCAAAEANMESNLNSYHSRSACHQQVGSDISLPVLEALATSCTVNSSGSAVVSADVCCEPPPSLSCSAAVQASVGGLHYPSTSCPTATAAAENSLNSWHYRNACNQQVGSSISTPVLEALVTSCSVNSSGSAVVALDVCCVP